MVKIGFDELQIHSSGFTEIIELLALDTGIRLASHFFKHTFRFDFVADSSAMRLTYFVKPAIVPNPNVFLMFKELALMAFWDWAKQGSSELRLCVNQIGVSHFAGVF